MSDQVVHNQDERQQQANEIYWDVVYGKRALDGLTAEEKTLVTEYYPEISEVRANLDKLNVDKFKPTQESGKAK